MDKDAGSGTCDIADKDCGDGFEKKDEKKDEKKEEENTDKK